MPSKESKNIQEATCPFCGLLCDDIIVKSDNSDFSLMTSGCEVAKSRYSSIAETTQDECVLHDKTVDRRQAIRKAAEMISKSKALAIIGMMTDVAGTRTALELAERKSAVIMQGADAQCRSNPSRMQRAGGYFATLAEIRNRADLIILFGDGPTSECPRLLNMLERRPTSDNPEPAKQSLVYVGAGGKENDQRAIDSNSFDCNPEQFGMLADSIKSRIQQNRRNRTLGFISDEHIDQLYKLISEAEYPVLIWSESDFNFPLADLAMDSIHQLIEELNKQRRSAGLIVSGSSSSVTVDQVATWQFGKPVPLSFRTDTPKYFPKYHSFESLEKRNDVDLIVWIGGLENEIELPTSSADTIVISSLKPTDSQLFIPVGIPGIHHDAHLFRTDQVVAMHIRQTATSLLPSSADVLKSILTELEA